MTDSYAIKSLSLTEIENVHQWLATMFRSFGMTGDELDQAIATCFRQACMHLDDYRAARLQARNRLRVVTVEGRSILGDDGVTTDAGERN